VSPKEAGEREVNGAMIPALFLDTGLQENARERSPNQSRRQDRRAQRREKPMEEKDIVYVTMTEDDLQELRRALKAARVD